LTVTTRGEPEFIAGKTPAAADHPYVRFVRPETTATATEKQDVASNRPTTASSETLGHNSARAVDGDLTAYWSAGNDLSPAWWQVDLEQPHTITSVQTTFPTPRNYRYRIESSPDGNIWRLLVDDSKTDSAKKTRTDTIPAGQRITFTGLPNAQPAAMADVKIEGKHWP